MVPSPAQTIMRDRECLAWRVLQIQPQRQRRPGGAGNLTPVGTKVRGPLSAWLSFAVESRRSVTPFLKVVCDSGETSLSLLGPPYCVRINLITFSGLAFGYFFVTSFTKSAQV